MKDKLLLSIAWLISLLCLSKNGAAQQQSFHGWFFSSHEQSINKKLTFLSDIQLRSSKQIRSVETLLLRPALQLEVTEKQAIAIGYAYLANWEREDGETGFEKEHRAWQQYAIEGKVDKVEITNRLRLEQRFLEEGFAQRLRYFLKGQLPFNDAPVFTKGLYMAAQNEVFLNIQHKEIVNNRFFDQTRAYIALGHRFKKGMEVESGIYIVIN